MFRNLLIFALGIVSALGIQQGWKASVTCDTHLNLLNPDAICANEQEERSEWDYEPLRQKLIQIIDQHAVSGDVPHIAIYFRDLQSGSRFSIRENEIFDAASLLKIPLMMVILHHADLYPELLDERLTYEKDYGKDFIEGPIEETLALHSSYTVRELLEKMIRYSDNRSSYVLLDKINELGMRQNSNTFADLGTMQLLLSGELDNTRLISLINIFVALYNGNYLSQESSQFALELLTQTTFDDGIVAGVPEDIRVAHKFGIRTGTPEESELHDCGIVYHPSAPYVLCVLTAGANADTASLAIRELSRTVYEHMNDAQP